VPVLAVTFILNEPFPVRFVGVMCEIVIHVALVVGVFQVVFDVTFICAMAAAVPGSHDVWLNKSVELAACVTVMCLVNPAPVTVTVPIRACGPVFAVTFSLNDPVPVWFAGVIFVTVSHVALLVGAFQVVLLITVIDVLFAADPGFHVVWLNVSVGLPACVTVICLVIPLTVTVTVPVRDCAPVFCVTFSLNEPLPFRALISIYISRFIDNRFCISGKFTNHSMFFAQKNPESKHKLSGFCDT